MLDIERLLSVQIWPAGVVTVAAEGDSPFGRGDTSHLFHSLEPPLFSLKGGEGNENKKNLPGCGSLCAFRSLCPATGPAQAGCPGQYRLLQRQLPQLLRAGSFHQPAVALIADIHRLHRLDARLLARRFPPSDAGRSRP